MNRQDAPSVPMKALKFVGLILLLAAIAACFGLLAKQPADAGRLAHYGLRLLLIALCLTGWFWTQAMISARSVSNDAVLFDGLHELTAPLNAYLNGHPRLANGLLIVTSAFIDLLGLFLIIWSVLGPSMRPFGATDMVPNHCQASRPSVCTATGALQVAPPSSERMKWTSIGSESGGSTEHST